MTTFGSILSKGIYDGEVTNMTDVYNQVEFMTKINSQTEGGTFDFQDFFTGYSSQFSGTVRFGGESATMTISMAGSTGNLDKQPIFDQKGAEPNSFNYANYYTSGAGRNLPTLQIVLKNYGLRGITDPKN